MFSKVFHARKLLVLALSVLLIGCTAANQVTTKPTATTSNKPVIKFIANTWVGSEVNVEVARYILENQMGYPTEIVRLDASAQWDSLAKGDGHASLEVWPSGRVEAIQKYIEQDKTVVRGSALGVTGKVGWYIPTYMLKTYPQLATWRGFLDPQVSALFATDKSNGKGQFLAGDPSWIQYDGDIIRNLGLNLQVVRVEGKDAEGAEMAALDKAYKAKQPILFYFWTPHWAYILYDLTEVTLPPYSADCYANAKDGKVACDYPTDVLFKIYWPGLKAYAPQAYQFLENFHYTNRDQIAMLASVQVEKKTPREAAIAWINQHESTWKQWLP